MMKLPKKDEVRSYELTFLVPHALTSDESQGVLSSVEKLVTKQKGKISSQEEWGKKPLSYTIQTEGKRYTEAAYHHWVLAMKPSTVNALTTELRHADHVLRSLVVQISEEHSVEEKK